MKIWTKVKCHVFLAHPVYYYYYYIIIIVLACSSKKRRSTPCSRARWPMCSLNSTNASTSSRNSSVRIRKLSRAIWNASQRYDACCLHAARSLLFGAIKFTWSDFLGGRNLRSVTILSSLLLRSYSTQGRVSTAMDDCLRAGKPSRYLTSRLDQLSLPSLRGR